MPRLATFTWQTPPPTSVDEELAVFDDSTAQLVVRRSRSLSGPIGTFECGLSEGDWQALSRAGPGPIVFDLLRGAGTDEAARLMELANRVATAARQTPLAVAEFFARRLPSDDDSVLSASLLVLASGRRAVEFELDPDVLALHFVSGGQPVGWLELPEPGMGFVSPDAEWLGGLRARAELEPGRYGAIRFDVSPFGGATAIEFQVGGWLSNAPSDEPMPARFETRTAPADLDV